MGGCFFLKGVVVGLIIALPVGPIGVLCLYRTLTQGRLCGLVSGLGAATADAFYGAVAAWGVSFVAGVVMHEQIWFRIVGGVALGVLGGKIFFTQPAGTVHDTPKNNPITAYLSAFFLTLTNPTTIISFAGAFAALGVTDMRGHYVHETELVLGVFSGSALWWLILGSGFKLPRVHPGHEGIRWIYRIFGVLIAGLGLLMLLSLIFYLF